MKRTQRIRRRQHKGGNGATEYAQQVYGSIGQQQIDTQTGAIHMANAHSAQMTGGKNKSRKSRVLIRHRYRRSGGSSTRRNHK